ncbi:hypothetical protein OSB04_021299 [Centaurea solstitialis]|uniref:CCHC-type domain-containing protein n=1 Tax=Centaurea solstitialis TaxID=347529 RepID=A0AA38T5A2_9ASTR|nr:hypothetical protein OSB04_021299 [Centaurea solstitialis]
MANTVTNTNNLSLRSILEKDKLTGPNFLDWERNLQIVLRHERKWYVLEEPLGEAPPANASTAIRNAYQKRSDDLLDVGCLMLATMSPELQTGLMNTNAYDMIRQLRDMFQTQARTERYDATRALNACKMAKGTSVSAHVMKMKRLLDHLERLGHPVPLQLATDTILNSLSDDYKQFVMNFNMNNMERSIAELHSMLKTAEQSMGTGTKTKDVLMVRDGGVKKKRGQRNTSKGKDQVQVSQSVPKAVDNRKGKGKGKKVKVNKVKAENRCFTCHEVGHWRHNCPKRHETEWNMDYTKLSNSYKRCRPKTARIFDRAANIGCDPLQEFNPNLGPSVQHPDDPLIITISVEELYNVNESLALISHNVQKLNANRGFNRSRGSGFPSGGRMGQGRGGHYQLDRAQYGNHGRGNYHQGERFQGYDQGSFRNYQGRYREDQGRYRENQERFRDQPRRDNTYLDYQEGPGRQEDWRGQVSVINYRRSLRQYTPESGYIDRQGYEGGYGGRYESGRLDQGPGYGFEQDRSDSRADERMDRGKGSYNGGDSRGNSSRQAQREDQQLGHYARDCSVKYKDAAYFEKKAALMRKKEKGVALLVDEENWVCEEESSDEDDHLVKGLCLMADFEGSEAVDPSTYQDIDPSEVSTIPDITDTVAMLESKICELERCLQSERTLVTKFRIDSAIYKSSLEDLTIVYNRETLESGIRESNLPNKLGCLQKAHEELNSDHGELNIKFQLLSEERTRLFSKIQELEDNNFKRGQFEQTLSILTQHAKKNPFYKAKPDLGLSENHVLDKTPSHLYNFEDMAASKPKPALVGGHVTEEFVRQTVTYTEVINGETITRTTSPSNSTSGSPPTSPPPNRPIFVPASDPTNTEPTWEGIKARTPRVAMPPINYSDLNTSYDTREMDFSEETLVIPPEDVAATKSPDLVKLEKEVFELRLKAMDLDAYQHQLLNLRVIVSEKDTLVRTLEKDLLKANAERIRLSSECETATSTFTDFQIKVADLQTRYVLLDIHFEILKELDHDERIMYRQSLTNQQVSNSLLKKKVMSFENLCFIVSDDDDEPPNSHHRIAEPKTVHDPNIEYDLKVFLDEGDDPSGFIPKKPKSVVVKPEKPIEPRAPISEKSNPEGEKCVGTDKGKSVKPHAPKGLQKKHSKSNDARNSVKPIKSLDFHSSTFEVGETSQLQPNQPFNSTKPKFSKISSGNGGNSIPTKPSSNSHRAFHADARRKDGGQNVKPPRKDHHGRNNSFSAFPKKHSPSRAGLGYAPPSVGMNSNMSVNCNRNLNDAFNTFRNDMCFMFDNFLRYGVSNSFNAPQSNVKSRKRRGRKRGKAKSYSSVKSPPPKEKSEKETTPTDISVSNPKEPIWQWVPKQA